MLLSSILVVFNLRFSRLELWENIIFARFHLRCGLKNSMLYFPNRLELMEVVMDLYIQVPLLGTSHIHSFAMLLDVFVTNHIFCFIYWGKRVSYIAGSL